MLAAATIVFLFKEEHLSGTRNISESILKLALSYSQHLFLEAMYNRIVCLPENFQKACNL